MKNKNWFVSAADNEFETYFTQAEALAAAKLLIPKYLVDGVWEEGVDEIKVGCFTHEVVVIDRVDRPVLNEDGDDREGNSWGDLEYKCNYALAPNPLAVIDTVDVSNWEIVPYPLPVESNIDIIAKVAICVRATDDSHCLYEAYRSPYGKHEGSQYQKGDRFIIKQERVDAIVVIDADDDWILIPNSELSCFDLLAEDSNV
jgi:hypothetical protein